MLKHQSLSFTVFYESNRCFELHVSVKNYNLHRIWNNAGRGEDFCCRRKINQFKIEYRGE